MSRILAGLLALSLSPSLFAQQQDIQTQQDLEQKRRTQEQVRKTSEEAQKTVLKDSVEKVTYAEVMKDPDNIELNYKYARYQVSRGDILKAAGTLERVLMVNPELSRVRLLYASILMRLDNLDDAQRELQTLTKQKLTDSMRAELDGYSRQIKQRRKKTRLGLALAGGFDWDTNRNSAPASGTRLAANVPVILDSASTRKNDTSKTMTASFNLSHDLGYQAGHSLFASGSYYRAEQTGLRTLNLQSYNGSAGGTFKTTAADFTATMSFGHLILAEATYQRSWGPSLRIDKRVGNRLSFYGTAGHQRQEYSRTGGVPAAPERTGDQHFGGAGLNYVVSRGLSMSLSATHTIQGALEPYNAYRREAFNMTLTKILAQGRFAMFSFTPQLDFYGRADVTVAPWIRKDTAYRTTLTFGTPLGFIASPLNDLLLTLSYEYLHALSNLPNNSYSNNKLSSSLTYRINF